MANDGMDLADFLGHKTRDLSKTNYLGNWKKRSPPQIDIFIHPKSRIIAVWQHPWPKLVERTRDDKTTIEVWSGSFNSWESEDVLRQQYRRDQSTGERAIAPQVCPMSMLIEEVHRLIREGELDWCEMLFRFVGTDPEKAKVINAAGLYNAYGNKKLTDSQKAEMKRAGISQKTAWQQNMMAKCNYIFPVIDNDHLAEGIQVTTETTLLGDKVKSVIKDEMTSEGDEEGNPILNPYCIRWKHVPDAESFSDKYKALRMRKIPVTDELQNLFDQEPPDTAWQARRGNIKALRDSMEAAYCGPEGLIDFDAIFEKAEELEAASSSDEEEPDEKAIETAKVAVSKATSKAAKPAKKAKVKVKVKKPEPEEEESEEEPEEEESEEEVEMFACDHCDKSMREDEFTCPHCGAIYDEESGELIKVPEKKPKRRSAGKKSGSASNRAKASGKDKIDF